MHLHVYTCIFYWQVWHARTGDEVLLCNGIVDSEDSVVLCVNLSTNNCRLVASNSAGLVMVYKYQIELHPYA